jgi:hypothetical protein
MVIGKNHRGDGPPELMSFADVDAAVRASMRERTGTVFGFENALRDYLATDQITKISDAALARYVGLYRLSRNGHAEEVVGIIAGEQERRAQAVGACNQKMAKNALSWSRWGAVAAAVAAVASMAALLK